jgi:thiamine biosynthesis lipoprotein
MSHWIEASHEERRQIMKTDVFMKLFSDQYSEEEMIADIMRGFQMMRDFEARFSRFDRQSELSCFNASEGGEVSQELFRLLKECSQFYEVTEGIFDPSILPVLEKIGYRGEKRTGESSEAKTGLFAQLIFNEEHQTIYKPRDVFIDLGGIGKGYIVDKVADELTKKYTDGIVDAGGDMRLFGGDKKQNLNYLVIDVENPFDKAQILSTLLLSDVAVATSGTSRKNWYRAGRKYHHIIDPSRETSAETGVVQVTVIMPRATEADVFAKTLFILGVEQGLKCASEKSIPALFVDEDKRVTRNSLFQKYEWKK